MSDIKGKTILITGAAGCIGAWVVKKLLMQGARPIIFDLSKNTARLDLIMDNTDTVIWETGDITDYDRLSDVIAKHKVFAIIHLAAMQTPYCKANPINGIKINVLGTANVFEVARQYGIKRLTYASSIAAPAMGNNDFLATLYGAHKVCGEHMAAVYWQDWQVPSVCIRPGVIYGPGRDQGMSAAPTVAILAAINKQDYTIPFSGPVAFVHVEDAADRFIAVISRDVNGAPVFDMQGTEADVMEVANEIKLQIQNANIKLKGPPLPFPHAPDDGSLDRFINVPPYRSLRDGIADTIAVFKRVYTRHTASPKSTHG